MSVNTGSLQVIDLMTSPSPTSQRRRVAWLIGVVVIVGVGAMVVGNWDTIRIKYYVRRINSLDEEAANKLIEIGEPAVDYVIPFLKSGNGGVDQMCCSILDNIGTPAIPALERTLSNPDDMARWNAARTLALMAGADGVMIIDVAINRRMDLTRAGQLSFDLRELKEIVPTLEEKLSDTHPRVQYWAAVTLKILGHTPSEIRSKIDAILDEAKK